MIEDAAKAKWCPFARVSNDSYSQAANRYGDKYNVGSMANSNCLGSGCMAWRWEDMPPMRVNPRDCPECKGDGGDCSECEGTGRVYDFEGHGYCGLAGKP
jgi:DnaJ-class molecular chaperone